ncbi:MAG: GNAT family N-acetyltransferase [Alphaproteobacteria bacterium]|nr:GNAT family N-acetyltransferase [Alphaproteobacteria bacterium]
MSVDVRIAVEQPTEADAIALIGESDRYSALLYPPESRHTLDTEALRDRRVTFLVARIEGRAVGCGALVRTGTDYAEIKRMYVTASARGRRIGFRLLAALEAIARTEAMGALRLETGIHNRAALALYEAAGYRRTGPFGAYRPDPLSVFMVKEFVPAASD